MRAHSNCISNATNLNSQKIPVLNNTRRSLLPCSSQGINHYNLISIKGKQTERSSTSDVTTVSTHRRRNEIQNNLSPSQLANNPLLRPVTEPTYFVPTLSLANVMSLAPKIDEVRLFLHQNSVDIFCITETWLKDLIDDSVINVENYTLVRKDRIHAQHGGVALYIRDTINFSRLREHEDSMNHIEVLWCKLRPHRLPRGFPCLIIGVLYHPPSSNDDQMIEYLLNTLSNIESAYPNSALLLAGDFNRLDVSQVINQFRLKQLVNFATRGERTLDLILSNLSDYYQDPAKSSPFGLSDHCTVTVSPKVRPKSANWKALKKITVRDMRLSSKQALARYLDSLDWSIIDTLNSTEEKSQFFNKLIHIGLDTIMPARTVKIHTCDAPWITGHLKSLIQKRQQAFVQNRPVLFRYYRNRVNRERKSCKSKYYQAKLKDLKDNEPKKWWSECKRLCGMSKSTKDIVSMLLPGDSSSHEAKYNLANEINAAFIEPQQGYLALSPTNRLDTTNSELPSVSLDAVAKQLSSVSATKACGPDNIPNWILKDFSHILASPVCKIINSSLAEKHLPHIWKCANISPIPKNPSIDDINKDLRPISLTPTVSKIAEDYVVCEHVKPAVLSHIGLDQYGCIPNSSTTHALINLIHNWSKATDSTGADVRVLVLDYKKAFDLIDHNILVSKLSSYGINPHVVNWICDFLSSRSQRVKLAVNCYSEWKSVPAGVPQGTKLGPWLFLVMINDLEITSSNGTVKYVDDTTAYDVIPKGMPSSTQSLVDEVVVWSQANKFQLHPKKCKEMRISFSRSTTHYEDLLIDTNIIETVDSFKLLGVTIQNNLKWNAHINITIKKASKRLYFLSKLKRANVPPKDLVRFYITCIRPVLLYACQVFHFNLPEYLNVSLERIQKRAMKIIYGYDISYNSTLEQAGINKLSERRLQLCDNFFNKVVSNPRSQLYNLVPHNVNRQTSLRHVRPFTIPLCKTNRFRNSFLISSARRHNFDIK